MPWVMAACWQVELLSGYYTGGGPGGVGRIRRLVTVRIYTADEIGVV